MSMRPLLGFTVSLMLVTWACLAFGQANDDESEPLRPPDVSSPQGTVQSFVEDAREAVERFAEVGYRDAEFARLRERVFRTLDLSQIPPVNRVDRGTELAAYLVEIFNRIDIPPLAEIPNAEQVEETGIDRWQFPGTEIYIAEIREGDFSGDWKFSSETLRRLPDFYEYSKHLPLKADPIPFSIDAYRYSPGSLLPISWVDSLPSWADEVVAGQAVWQWLATGLFAGGAVVLFVGLHLIGRRWDFRRRWNDRPAGHLGRLAPTLLAIALYYPATAFIEDGINLSRTPLFVAQLVLTGLVYLAIAWAAILMLNSVGEMIIRWRKVAEGTVDAQLTRILVRFIGALVVIYFGLLLSEQYGVPAAPLIASLGVSSLAVALAVRPTLENIINGFILFADKPVRVGEFCGFGSEVGTVERIGLRSTRIRLLDRRVLTIPNSEFATMQISNFARRDQILLHTTIGLRYETTPDQLRFVLSRLRELFVAHPKISPDPARARFVNFGAYSLDVELFAYVDTNDWGEYLGICEDVNLRIMDLIAEAGTGFAFPSQTAYLARDAGLDSERTKLAEASVESWRAETQLPFPSMAPERVAELTDSLDFPPVGSQRYRQPTPTAGDDAGKVRSPGRWRSFRR